jgi:hypothetical protein
VSNRQRINNLEIMQKVTFSNIDYENDTFITHARKVGVCITSEENGESKLTSEENLFNTTQHEYNTTSMGGPSGRDLNPADLAVVSEDCCSSFHHPTVSP